MEQFDNTEQSADFVQPQTERTSDNPDMISAEYSYDREQFCRMSRKISLKKNILVSLIVAVLFGTIFGTVILLVDEIVVRITLAVMYVVFITMFIVGLRRGARNIREKNFAMYGKDGVISERIEIEGNTLSVANLGTDSHSRVDRSGIRKVRMYDGFFTVALSTGTVKPVPLTPQTRPLYDALTDDALFDRAAAAHPEKLPDRPVERPTNVLCFDYELTREQTVRIMRSYGVSRMGIVCVSLLIVMGAIVFISGFFKTEKSYFIANLSLGCVLMAVGILLSVLIFVGIRNVSSNGAAYFEMNSRDGKVLQRIELSQQGIVVVNVLKDYRTNFRLADMARIRRGKGYFVVEFATNEVLPIPINAETSRLCDTLVAALTSLRGVKLK